MSSGTEPSRCIAERRLLFSSKAAGARTPFAVRVYAPRELEAGDVGFVSSQGSAECIVRLEGLPGVFEERAYGADLVQALQHALDYVEPMLRRFGKKYDVFFEDGEHYFDD